MCVCVQMEATWEKIEQFHFNLFRLVKSDDKTELPQYLSTTAALSFIKCDNLCMHHQFDLVVVAFIVYDVVDDDDLLRLIDEFVDDLNKYFGASAAI